MSVKGSCLCGSVKFEIDGEFDNFFLCHCSYCRKDTGSAHASNLFSSKAKLKWNSGQELVKNFNLPSTRHIKSFCSKCGSAMPFELSSMVVIPAGSLDDQVSIKPTAHIFMTSKANWDEGLEEVHSFDGFPNN
ncbi:aldehyde-activating protein [Candidatus Francisella endociliophora]|uniref:Aldehyde-activating protein n=1 Tax=Candidatus Francisella endociliophora TaxID=653937 RepID=A0A097ENJ9_9GAMM|nr:GFA family protein [Francisella sp. FSC1006]AIT09142.1 aldehyde-activating protein [Francisella sp. FSC1006]